MSTFRRAYPKETGSFLGEAYPASGRLVQGFAHLGKVSPSLHGLPASYLQVGRALLFRLAELDRDKGLRFPCGASTFPGVVVQVAVGYHSEGVSSTWRHLNNVGSELGPPPW